MSRSYNFREFVEDTFDFARCLKSNGDIYGIEDGDRCRKGKRIPTKTVRRDPVVPSLIRTVYHFPPEIQDQPFPEISPNPSVSTPVSQLSGDTLNKGKIQKIKQISDLSYPELLKQQTTETQRAIINRAKEKHRIKWQKYLNNKTYDPNFPTNKKLEEINKWWMSYNPDLTSNEIPIIPGLKLQTMKDLYGNTKEITDPPQSISTNEANSEDNTGSEDLPVIVPRHIPESNTQRDNLDEDLLLWLGDDDDYDVMGDDTETLDDFFASYNNDKTRPTFIHQILNIPSAMDDELVYQRIKLFDNYNTEKV